MYEISECIKRKDVQGRTQMHREGQRETSQGREFHEKLLPRRSGMVLND